MQLPDQEPVRRKETFIKVYRSILHFRGDSSFLTWVNRVAQNHALDYLRRRRRRPEVLGFSGPEGHDATGPPVLHRLPSPEPGPEIGVGIWILAANFRQAPRSFGQKTGTTSSNAELK